MNYKVHFIESSLQPLMEIEADTPIPIPHEDASISLVGDRVDANFTVRKISYLYTETEASVIVACVREPDDE